MSAMSDYLEDLFLNWVKGSSMGTLTNVYVALFDGDPTEAGGGGTEITTTLTGSASRTAITLGAVSDSGAAKQVANSADTLITAAAAAGASATHVGIFDAATGGNLLFVEDLVAVKTFNIGDEVKFAAGALIIKAQ